MSITKEQEEDIINRAVEKALLQLPYVMGSLLDSHAAMMKVNKKFYDSNPEFKNHPDVVASVVEQIDGENTLLPYDQKLTKAIPEIRRRIASIKPLDMSETNRPIRKLIGSMPTTDNGEL